MATGERRRLGRRLINPQLARRLRTAFLARLTTLAALITLALCLGALTRRAGTLGRRTTDRATLLASTVFWGAAAIQGLAQRPQVRQRQLERLHRHRARTIDHCCKAHPRYLHRLAGIADQNSPNPLFGIGIGSRAKKHHQAGVPIDPTSGDSAADPDASNRQPDRHRLRLAAGDLAGHEAESAPDHLRRDLAAAGLRIVNEFIDRKSAVRADSKDRFVQQQDLHSRVLAGGNLVAQEDVVTAFGRPAHRRTQSSDFNPALHRRRNAGLDPRLRQRRLR